MIFLFLISTKVSFISSMLYPISNANMLSDSVLESLIISSIISLGIFKTFFLASLFSIFLNREVVTKIEKYKKEIEKLNKKALKLLDKSLGDFIPEEAFKIKSREIKEEIDTIKSKLYFIEENKDKVLTENEIIKILNSFKEKNDKEIDTEIVETFKI